MSGYLNYIQIQIGIESQNWKLKKIKLKKNQIGKKSNWKFIKIKLEMGKTSENKQIL